MTALAWLKPVLKRGALVAAANWPVTLIEATADSVFKLLIATPIVGGYTPATATFELKGTVTAGDIVGLAWLDENYKHDVVTGDTLATVAEAIKTSINAGAGNITATRSARVSTSRSSADTSRIALPASRALRSVSWMNSIAPTSTPRVGCAASSTTKSRASSRASS